MTTESLPFDAVFVLGGNDHVDELLEQGDARQFVVEAFLDRADRLERTELEASSDGDTYVPAWQPGAAWHEVEHEEREGVVPVTYERSSCWNPPTIRRPRKRAAARQSP